MKLDVNSFQSVGKKVNMGLATDQTVASLARPLAPLNVASSLTRALETLRQSTLDLYPLVSGSRLLMLLSERKLSAILLALTPEEQDRYRLLPISAVLHLLLDDGSDEPMLSATDSLDTAKNIFQQFPHLSVIGVVDNRGSYFGVLTRGDFLAGSFRTLAPPRVGGMATPLGVYLTDGIEAGGVGNFALLLAGASLSSLFIVAVVGTNWLTMTLVDHHIDLANYFIKLLLPIMPSYAVSFVYNMQSLIPLAIMMLLLRAIPVAGFHAAEHQVVHCIERGEPLIPAKVASMPRPHPRCGTNLVAAVTMFGLFFSIFSSLFQASSAIVPAALLTFLTWRQVGTFLQQHVTTRTASPSQLASGIAAGEDLLTKYRVNTNRRVKLPMRIWRMGFIQMLAGCTLLMSIVWALSKIFPQMSPYIQGIN